ncbi:MAG TPA: glycoside hydrolase family 76 protein [Abditibacteriaceae bacterium]|jgi:uncharacterized protein YyaL (SSP411 family)
MKQLNKIYLVCGALFFSLLPTAQANYKAKAEETMNFIQANLYDEKAKLYHPAVPLKEKELPYDFMWGNGVQFSALVGATRHNPQKYKPLMYAFAEGLKKYWDAQAPIPGFDAYFASPTDDDKYYDDNAWLVLGFAEAYELTKDPMFLDWARRAHKFVLSGWDEKLGGGIYWRPDQKSKNTCVSAPAAVSALRLYHLGDKDQLQWAQRLCTWTNNTLQDKDGLFWDNISTEAKNIGQIEKTKWTYNTALMLRANIGLYKVTKDAKYLLEARRMADAGLKKWTDPQTGGFADEAKFNHLWSEALLELYEATKDLKYLNAVRRDADFAWRYVRDPNGGFWNKWRKGNRSGDERKTMIENAAPARLFWLLAPYLDVEELRAAGEKSLQVGDHRKAADFFQQALESTSDIGN